MTGMEHRRRWEQFASQVASRLDRGAREYGDASWKRPACELATEVREELLDVAGWAMIMWHRLRDLEVPDTLGSGPKE